MNTIIIFLLTTLHSSSTTFSLHLMPNSLQNKDWTASAFLLTTDILKTTWTLESTNQKDSVSWIESSSVAQQRIYTLCWTCMPFQEVRIKTGTPILVSTKHCSGNLWSSRTGWSIFGKKSPHTTRAMSM